MSSDHKYFNCSEQYEIDYVKNQYKKPEQVETFLKAQCKLGKIKYYTHDQVYQLLKNKGYEKK